MYARGVVWWEEKKGAREIYTVPKLLKGRLRSNLGWASLQISNSRVCKRVKTGQEWLSAAEHCHRRRRCE
jgi:hypothetical protein